jgi:hypothetical protein
MLAQDRISQLNSILNDPQTTLSSVLELPYITQLARLGLATLRSFIAPHAKELLQYAFSPDDSRHSTPAFKILTCGHPEYLRPLLESGMYVNYATELLIKPDISSLMVGRLSSLTVVALLNLPELACDACGFLYRLLPFCENPTVFNLFETLTGDDQRISKAQEWLRDFGFCMYIPREIGNIDFQYVSTGDNVFKDPVYNRACYLFQLISRGSGNPILGAELRTPDVVQCLQRQFPKMPDFVQIARWDAILAQVSEGTAEMCQVFVGEAVSIVCEEIIRLKKYHVAALSFLTNMMELLPDVIQRIESGFIPSMLISLTAQFHSSTILHNAFLKFTEVGLKNKAFAEQLVRLYLPFLIVNGESNDNRILRSCCIRVMELFITAAKSNSGLKHILDESPEVGPFIDHTIKPFRTKSTAKYGGDMPIDLSVFKGFFT